MSAAGRRIGLRGIRNGQFVVEDANGRGKAESVGCRHRAMWRQPIHQPLIVTWPEFPTMRPVFGESVDPIPIPIRAITPSLRPALEPPWMTPPKTETSTG